MSYSQLNDIIKSSKNILVISHINPDGDTLGSICAMSEVIRNNFKKECELLCVSKIPKTYEFLPNISKIKTLESFDKSREFDLVITVDVAAPDRMGDAKILFDKAKSTTNIDHHKTNKGFANLNIIDPDASSCGEVLADIFKGLDWKINLETATCIYTAILTDTGSFRYDNTTEKALKSAADMIAIGVKPSEIYKKIYESSSKNHVLFQAYCISKTEFCENDKVAYTTVFKKDIEKFNAPEDCTEGLTEKLRAIVTTEIAFVVRQLNANMSKVSMRSKSKDVAEICEVFGGGGHKLAAGCVVKCSVEDTIKKILEEIKKREI